MTGSSEPTQRANSRMSGCAPRMKPVRSMVDSQQFTVNSLLSTADYQPSTGSSPAQYRRGRQRLVAAPEPHHDTVAWLVRHQCVLEILEAGDRHLAEADQD